MSDRDGFARVNNLVPEKFLVQIVRKAPGSAAESWLWAGARLNCGW